MQGFSWKGVSEQSVSMGILVNDINQHLGECKSLEDLANTYVIEKSKKEILLPFTYNR